MEAKPVKLLLHVCCAPCSVRCIASLREEGIEPVLFWYNPNIHPFTEYKNRRDSLVQYAQNLALQIIMDDQYGLRQFIRTVNDHANRCISCYALRMDGAAITAKEKGFDAFCTTLFISPYQNHQVLKEQAEAAAEKYGIQLLYRDFRPQFYESRAEGRHLGFYMQKYCGCILSEEERYLKKK